MEVLLQELRALADAWRDHNWYEYTEYDTLMMRQRMIEYRTAFFQCILLFYGSSININVVPSIGIVDGQATSDHHRCIVL